MEDIFLALVRFGIGKGRSITVPKNNDWDAIKALADRQGLSAIIAYAIEKTPTAPCDEILQQWRQDVLKKYECRYDQFRSTITEMAKFYHAHGFKMMLIDEAACIQDWPKPEYRPSADIGIWIGDERKNADAALSHEKKVKIARSYRYCTVFHWNDFRARNYCDSTGDCYGKEYKGLVLVFKELGFDSSKSMVMNGELVYLPSSNFQAIFMINNAFHRFLDNGVTLTHVLDWAFFFEKHNTEINWDWLNNMLGIHRMKEYFNCINAICVEELGFESNFFHGVQFNPYLKDKVLKDILLHVNNDLDSLSPLSRMFHRYKYRKSNQWKREIFCKEIRKSSFWSKIQGFLLKLVSI